MQEQTIPSIDIVIRGQYIVEGLLSKSSANGAYLVRAQ